MVLRCCQVDVEVMGCQRHTIGHAHTLLNCPQHHQTELGFDSSTSTLGTTCLVDGPALNITPLHECMVPPPMAAARLVFPTPVCLTAWAPSHAAPTTEETLAVGLSGGGVCVVRCSGSWDALVEGMEGAGPAPDDMYVVCGCCYASS